MRGVRAGPGPQLRAVAWALATGPRPLALEHSVRNGLPCCFGISDDKGLVVDLTGRANGALSKAFVMSLAGVEACRLQPGGQFWEVVEAVVARVCSDPGRALPWLREAVARVASGASGHSSQRIDGVTHWVWSAVLEDGVCVMVQVAMR